MTTNQSVKRKALTVAELGILREKIISELNGLIFKGIVESEEFNLPEEDRKDSVDHANTDCLNSQRLRFRNREVFYEKKLKKALARIEKGEYGICEECEGPIGFERLRARPTAEKCITCKEESEKDESNNYHQRKSKSYGNAIGYVKSF